MGENWKERAIRAETEITRLQKVLGKGWLSYLNSLHVETVTDALKILKYQRDIARLEATKLKNQEDKTVEG